MEGEAAAAILQVVVQNLIDHSKKEISLIRDLHKHAAKLTETLLMIQKFLNDAETRTVPGGEAVKAWLNKLENAAFDADNVLDELNYHLLSNTIITKPIKEKVLSLSCFFFCSSFNQQIARPRKMALTIKHINENLDSINKEATELGLKERLANVNTHLDAAAASETDSFALDPIFIGRGDDVFETVEMLTNDENELISIVPIVGMGGLGKTTLARKVFNHPTINTQFGSLLWVHVSQIFDPIILFKKILNELNSGTQAESRQDVLRKLQESFKDKTYLLVLDDVWNQDPLKWEDFINSLSGVTSIKGNAIVVTTRSTEVASIVNPLHTHELKGLSEEDCWSIIKAKTFGKEEEDLPSELETIGRKIARRCQGLPLAANVVGGILRNKSKEKWISIEEKWLSHDEGENITKILRLSFDSLSPPSLKKCFAYCSIFPKGDGIAKKELIEHWMAEGFLQADDGKNDMESVGEKFTNILLHSSLLQSAWRDGYGDVVGCGMHDLVHDLASSVLSSSVDGSRVRYMTLKDEASSVKKEEAKHLRTLVCKCEISGIMFSDFEGLHVLTLESYQVEELPSPIRELIHLRSLHISKTSISNLPEWIGELHHLQTLRANTRYLKKLPSTFKYLINLRHLYINFNAELPAEIGRLTCLQTLMYFRVGNKNGCRIEELGSLNNLKGRIQICGLERVGDKRECEKANIFKMSKLSELCLRWDTHREGETSNDEDVLEGLQPHPNLKKLVIWGFKGRGFPSWSMKMAVVGNVGLNNLTEIRLIDCSGCEETPMLGHLPSLKHLVLKTLSNVKRIDSSFYGLVKEDTRIVFPALERLELVSMAKLAEWAEVVEFASASESEVKVFPLLQYLEIKECKKLMSVPTHFPSCLKHLRIKRIGSSSMAMANIFHNKLALLEELSLIELQDLECLPDWLFYNNPNLSKLEINECPNLRELPQGLCTLVASLEELIISNCPNLQLMAAEGDSSFTSLRLLQIKKCPELLCLPCEMVGPALEELSLEGLWRLKNLPSLIERLPKSPRLTELRIEGVCKFRANIADVEMWSTSSFRSLRKVCIDASMEGSMESVDGILRGCCHSLQVLSLKGMEIWEEMPQSIQHLNAATHLKLESFGMEEVPEWLGNLSSLERIEICECKRLRRLPSTDAMRRLSRLQRLDINNCPKSLLLIQQQQQQHSRDEEEEGEDSEWLKISHIPYITIDGLRSQCG